MTKKKIYDRGLVRRIAGNLFSADAGGSSSTQRNNETDGGGWRPRKAQFFNRLDGDPFEEDDDDDPREDRDIAKNFSTESETGEYKRGLMFEHKKKVFKKASQHHHQQPQNTNNKRDLASINLKPSAKDRKPKSRNGNGNGNGDGRAKKRRTSDDLLQSPTDGDPFESIGHRPFNFDNIGCDNSVDESSKQTTSSRRSRGAVSVASSSHNTFHSDPTDLFFAKNQQTSAFFKAAPKPKAKAPPPAAAKAAPQTISLTSNNLATMAAMAAELSQSFSGDNNYDDHDGIENLNPRSKFYQFNVDEDKESTVILPVGFGGSFNESDDDDDEETTQDNGFYKKAAAAAPAAPAHKVDSPPRDSFFNPAKNDTTPINPPPNHFNFASEASVDTGFDAFGFNSQSAPAFEPKAASPPRPFLKAKKNDTPTQDPFKVETKSHFKFEETRTKRPSSPPRAAQNDPFAVATPSRYLDATHIKMNLPRSTQKNQNKMDPFGTPSNALNFTSSKTHRQNPAQPSREDSTRSMRSLTGTSHEMVPTRRQSPAPLAQQNIAKFEALSRPVTTTQRPAPSHSTPTRDKIGFQQRPQHPQSQPRPSRSQRQPLSSLNPPNSADRISTRRKDIHGFGFDPFAPKPDPDMAAWSNTSMPLGQMLENKPDPFEQKPDPGGDIFDSFSVPPRPLFENLPHSPLFNKPVEPMPEIDAQEHWDTSFAPRVKSADGVIGDDYEGEEEDQFDHQDDWGRGTDSPVGSGGYLAYRGASIGSRATSVSSYSKSSHGRVVPYLYSQAHSGSVSSQSSHKQDSVRSPMKPLGLPNNAIMASMLFRNAHNIDTKAVEAKIKAKDEEHSKIQSSRGDFPESVHAYDDTYSCVSSFSEDTGMMEQNWRKRSNNLLDYFATSSRPPIAPPAKISPALFEA
jgi:hypothetical protein